MARAKRAFEEDVLLRLDLLAGLMTVMLGHRCGDAEGDATCTEARSAYLGEEIDVSAKKKDLGAARDPISEALDALLLLGVQQAVGGDASISDQARRLKSLGLSNQSVGRIIGRSADYVATVTSRAPRKSESRGR